jgi:hypothetical protein
METRINKVKQGGDVLLSKFLGGHNFFDNKFYVEFIQQISKHFFGK